MTKLIILHGNKLDKDGALSKQMLERIDVLKDLLKQDTEISLVICGGKTTKKFNSEAKTIFDYLNETGIIPKNTKIVLEENSKTTAENIREIRKIFDELFPIKIEAITTKESVPRFKFLYKKLWPEVNKKVYFFSNNNSRKILRMIEKIYYWYSQVDPEYKWLKCR